MADRDDVAKKAGVSGATVSRTFNSPDSVSPSTRSRVIQAAQELGYHPNFIASNFVRKVSGNIGVIIPSIPGVHIFSAFYFSELLSGIGEALEEKGYNLMLFFHKSRADGCNDYTGYFKAGKVDGCILLGTRRDDTGLMELKLQGSRFCLVNNYIDNSGISFIDVDNVSGSYDAVSHLIKLGHRRIAFLNGPESYTNSRDRFRGYEKALAEADLQVDERNLLFGNYGKKSGHTASFRLLDMEERPTAVFAGNDRMAAGLIQGLKENGVRIPEDIAVVGYDDSDTASVIDPPLTTVRIPFFDMGKKCVENFLPMVNSRESGSFGIYIKPKLVVRESSKRTI